MREGHELWKEMEGKGILQHAILVFGQMCESPGVHFRVPLTAVTMAEFARDELGKDMLFLRDNVYRFIQAGNEVSVLLSRQIAAKGLYPAVDLLLSTSKFLNPEDVGPEHYEVAGAVRERLARYRELLDLISILGIEELSAEDRLVVKRARRLERFLTEEFTGRPGKHVPLAATIAGCRDIVSGRADELPEEAFFMVGELAGPA